MLAEEDDYYLELLKKHLEGTLSLEERDALHILIKDDPNRAFFLSYLNGHQADDEARIKAEIIYEKTQPNDLYLKASTPNKPFIIRKIWKKYRYIAAAACVACLLSLLWFTDKYHSPVEASEEWEQIVADKGERKFFRMSDGTEIWLNSESTLRIKKGYGKKHRIIDLKGEAYFSVAKNKELPLHVHALGNEIEVLGTVFNVRAYPEEKKMATSLVEGSVKLHVDGIHGKRDYAMNPGDKVEIPNKQIVKQQIKAPFRNDAASSRIVADDVDYKKISAENEEVSELMWINNKLVFNDDPLEYMVKKMERWYNRTIVIENDRLKEESFSGVFQERNCEQVLDLLQQTGGKFKYKVENGIIYLK
ncbi:FecR family protein [Sphingobacterium sp. N143]|uniref:FecR family protein n=1 Tax=Sphingobacterium sp. N143 TaxID=2746727 RepID=UPI002578F292|nr:FecR family protein [Sphingobacterium sp. N143]MDM1296161.1 FecR family protein [Sphingobacterium sp. N143]